MDIPNRNGSTDILAENFKRGAEDAGHSVEVIDVCHADIHPCIGCVKWAKIFVHRSFVKPYVSIHRHYITVRNHYCVKC